MASGWDDDDDDAAADDDGLKLFLVELEMDEPGRIFRSQSPCVS